MVKDPSRLLSAEERERLARNESIKSSKDSKAVERARFLAPHANLIYDQSIKFPAYAKTSSRLSNEFIIFF